jgi:hypothetical protein
MAARRCGREARRPHAPGQGGGVAVRSRLTFEAAKKEPAMANEMPNPNDYKGLSRKVLQYCDAFARIVAKIKAPGFTDAEWAPLEALVDVDKFERVGVFLTDRAEVFGWPIYKKYITQYGGGTSWEGTLRRITEVPGLVYLELEERNTRDGVTGVSNTVTIYEFNEAGKLCHLDVYVSHLA